MKITIKLHKSKGDKDHKSIVDLFKEVEELVKKYPLVSEVDMN